MAARVFEREVELFRQHGGGLRMAEALRLGINRKTLYAMRDAGVVVPVSRGVYRLASLAIAKALLRTSPAQQTDSTALIREDRLR